MKCPYIVRQTVQMNTNIFSYDENGAQTKHTHKLIEQSELQDCLQEECAVWRDGKCQYNPSL